MGLSAGTRLGPYEIMSPLGAGGMGEVYRARDTRLDRTVAIKVLNAALAATPDAKVRFEREAKAISQLNHPNICTLYDVGHQDDTDYLVMEFLEGETLADRLKTRGALPLQEIVRIGCEIAEALDKAHRAGIIHRDLKPGNVMLTKGGAKLLDFGLAKPATMGAAAGSGSAPLLSAAMTMTSPSPQHSPLTQQGSLVGTVQYMSPEQIQGMEADSRSDIFAFGAMLYEMATGRRPFTGKSQIKVASAILEDEPDPILQTQPALPAALDHVVRRCLAKNPDARWQAASDLKLELEWTALAPRGPQAAPAQAASARPLWTWLAAAAMLGVVGLVLGYVLHVPQATPLLRSEINLPAGLKLDVENAALALSPDGRRLAFIGVDVAGKQQIWVRPLDATTAQPLVGTEGATYPFWSPDSRFVGFFADHKLKKVDASGGTVQAICDAVDGRGASWSRQGVIVFAPRAYGPLFLVSAAGGTPVALTAVTKNNVTHRVPHFLPDGNHVLFYSSEGGGLNQKNGAIYSVDVSSKQVSFIANERSEARYAEPGYLLFVRDRNLMAQPFDARNVRTTGEAVPVAERIIFNAFRWTGEFAFSDNGLLVYQSGAAVALSQLTWYDLDGHKLGTLGEPAGFSGVFISPDGSQVVSPITDMSGHSDLWTYDVQRGIASRFTFGNSSFDDPVWSPDGKLLMFEDDLVGNLLVKPSDSSGEAKIFFSDDRYKMPSRWSPDGSTLLYCVQTSQGMDIWALPMTGERKPRPFIVTDADECKSDFSRDGRWLAYVSNESGRDELYVVAFPGLGAKRQISADGADSPNWIGNDRLAYINADRKLVLLDVKATAQGLDVGKPRIIFGGQSLPGSPRYATGVDSAVYIAHDGRRMLLPVPLSGSSSAALTLVSNWTVGMKK